MASFLRGKQGGVQSDLSAAILPGLFALDDRARYGINSQVRQVSATEMRSITPCAYYGRFSTVAYDPVQSLLAVGTNESPFGSGQIYIFGQARVQVTLKLPRRASVRFLQFCAERLVSVDSKNEVVIWSLQQSKDIACYSSPGTVMSLATDPGLDWAFIGLSNGEVIVYDLDREKLAPLRLPNFWRERNPKARSLSVVCMQLHPKDIGQLLIGYTEGAVIYSFKQNKPIQFFRYEIPAGARGGNLDPTASGKVRYPQLTQALWHPSGTFIATAYDESSLVFWDIKEARVLMARTLQDTYVDRPGGVSSSYSSDSGTLSLNEQYTRIAWCSKENLDDTGILVAGGQSMLSSQRGLTFLDLGPTPIYATSSWQALSTHFQGKRQHVLPTPPSAEVVDFCLIPKTSPHLSGAQDPIAVIAVLSSGELITLTFPSGHPISPTNQLHPSLAFVHPFVMFIAVTAVERERWLGMTETRQQGPPILRGGAEARHPLKRYEARNLLQMAHSDGTVRIFDAGHADELENSTTLQVDIARALGRYEDVDISLLSMAGATGELAVGTRAGEVVIFRWGGNRLYGREAPHPTEAKRGGIIDISERTEPALKQGLQPFTLYDVAQGPISALKMSDVGFVGIGSENGFFSIMDLRGPAVILSISIADFSKQEKRGGFIKKGSGDKAPANLEWAVVVEFGVMTAEGDDYSSILCFVGTNMGRVVTFKILPQGDGGYTAKLTGSTTLKDRVLAICPIVSSTGKPASATGIAVAGLREGQQVHGTLIVVTESEARIFKPAAGKGAHKSWDNSLCESANMTHFELHGYALVGIFGDGSTRAYSIPGLKELGACSLPMLDKPRISSTIITPSGDIFGWTSPSEVVMLNVWGTGRRLPISQDKLFNPEAVTPPRPAVSNLQWIAGTQYVSPTDLDVLIGGPDRPPSKRMLAAAAEEARRNGRGGPSRADTASSQEGWGDYLTRQLNERTEKLGIMGDSVERMQENSAGWVEDASKWAEKQKRNLVLKSITGKFF